MSAPAATTQADRDAAVAELGLTTVIEGVEAIYRTLDVFIARKAAAATYQARVEAAGWCRDGVLVASTKLRDVLEERYKFLHEVWHACARMCVCV